MIRCMVIDDELPARELLKMHLAGLDNFELVALFDNAVDGFNFLQKNNIALLFLDIHLPRLSGLELMRSLKQPPKIILTTAYREYAVEAFELDALDYLVKPITRERFIKAVSKFNSSGHFPTEKNSPAGSFAEAYIFLKVGTELKKIYLKDILYIEGLKDFTKVHTVSKCFIASERLSYMEEKLPETRFARIHKSYIASLDKIDGVYADQVSIENKYLPIGRVYKNQFLKILALIKT